jgi:GTPase
VLIHPRFIRKGFQQICDVDTVGHASKIKKARLPLGPGQCSRVNEWGLRC